MNDEQKLQKLISFLESKDITVKSDRGNFKGGLVRYYEDKYLYLNRKLDTNAKIVLILKEIKEFNFDENEMESYRYFWEIRANDCAEVFNEFYRGMRLQLEPNFRIEMDSIFENAKC